MEVGQSCGVGACGPQTLTTGYFPGPWLECRVREEVSTCLQGAAGIWASCWAHKAGTYRKKMQNAQSALSGGAGNRVRWTSLSLAS